MRVLLYLRLFGVRERRRFGEQAPVDSSLSDVVDERAQGNLFRMLGIQAQRDSQPNRENGRFRRMIAGVRIVLTELKELAQNFRVSLDSLIKRLEINGGLGDGILEILLSEEITRKKVTRVFQNTQG